MSLPTSAQRTPPATLTPQAPPVRVVGPGRRERAYQEEIVALGRRGAALSASLKTVQSELETAHLIERGTARFADRLEGQLARTEAHKARALVLVGSLQREVLLVRQQLERAQAQLVQLESAPPSLFQRVIGALRFPPR